MADDRKRQADVVEYWRAVELFSPQQVPPANAKERVYDLTTSGPAPWDAGHRERGVRVRDGMVRQHTVYCGLFELTAVRDTLLQLFGETAEDFDGRIRGESALFAVTVSDEGKLLPGTLMISSCGWATGRAVRRGPAARWLDSFDSDMEEMASRLLDLSTEPATVASPELHEEAPGGDADQPSTSAGAPNGTEYVSRPVDAALLEELLAELTDVWGVGRVLAPKGLRVKTVDVSPRRAEASDGDDFLNSFVAKDLGRVAASVLTEGAGAALTAFLTENRLVDVVRREDVRQRPDTALNGVDPIRTPLGRWPSDPDKPLALSQQFAVNAAKSELATDGGLFAVNGPPGTGKTTMLRDNIADLIVERALRLAALPRPSDAFSTTVTWRTGDYTRRVKVLSPQLTGFEMVVASANNGAVENISIEIPERAGALGERWRASADYFAAQATSLLDGKDAWAVIAARLGKKLNRSEFVNKFWYGQGNVAGLRERLDSYVTTPQTGVWSMARTSFQTSLERVVRAREERAGAAAALSELPAGRRAVEAARQATATAGEVLHRARADHDALTAVADQRQREFDDASARRREHGVRRPGFWIIVSTLGRAARDWHAEDQQLVKGLYDAEARLAQARAGKDSARNGAAIASSRAADCRAREADAVAKLARDESVVRSARARWPGYVPEDEWRTDETVRELSAPWSDPEMCEARSELFLAALELHKAFVRCTARTMKGNLAAAMDVVAGRVPRELGEAERLAAWQSLFLVVPVISTTFASLDRVFAGLARESLGWVFIDEAGQAAPQMAVGALWRARRAVVVGDPLQLEPVVPLPWTAQQSLRREFGVIEEWSPGRTSVQQVADRMVRFGTTVPAELADGSSEVWVGAPLRVHRRCDEPMFSISNTIAYDGLMVAGMAGKPPFAYSPPSCWVDVESAQADGHWVPEEGQVLRRILERLEATSEIEMERDVFVISPFRRVVAGARRVCDGLLPVDKVGTVHTTQGKEADVVVLVLGTSVDSSGSRDWAASHPNLLNVAVSRAKRRLFVIGNREAWRKHRYFDTLADRLPHHTWQATRGSDG